MMNRKFIKIMCIFLAALMALSGIAVLFTTFVKAVDVRTDTDIIMGIEQNDDSSFMESLGNPLSKDTELTTKSSRGPHTGDNDLDTIIPIALLGIAIVVVAVCLIMPKLKKKSETD